MTKPDPASIQVPVLWVGGDEKDVIKINQFVVQVESLRHVRIRTVGKYSVSADGLRELVTVLQNGLKMLEAREGLP